MGGGAGLSVILTVIYTRGVEPVTIYQSFLRWQTEDSRFGVAILRIWGTAANFDNAGANGEQGVWD